MVRSRRRNGKVAIEYLCAKFPARWQFLVLAAEVLDGVRSLALIDEVSPGLHDQHLPVADVDQINPRSLLVQVRVLARNLAGMVVALADCRFHSCCRYGRHPEELDRPEFALVAHQTDGQFIPCPMTAGVEEDVDCARFLHDLLFVLDDLGELFWATVVYPGRVVEVRYGVFRRCSNDWSNLTELVVGALRLDVLAGLGVLLYLCGHVFLNGLAEGSAAEKHHSRNSGQNRKPLNLLCTKSH